MKKENTGKVKTRPLSSHKQKDNLSKLPRKKSQNKIIISSNQPNIDNNNINIPDNKKPFIKKASSKNLKTNPNAPKENKLEIQPKKKINKKENKNIKNENLVNKEMNLFEEVNNLTSIYNVLSFINYKLDSTFNIQRNIAEQNLNEKFTEAIKLKENNFKIFQQNNSMTNIIDIDEYFIRNYDKIMSIFSKVSNITENMNDIVSNINYGLDRIYLIDDLLCDENVLQKNIIQTKNDFEEMNQNLGNKLPEINDNKNKYTELFNKLKQTEENIKKIESKLDSFKHNVLTNNIDSIYQILSEENKKLLNEILYE